MGGSTTKETTQAEQRSPDVPIYAQDQIQNMYSGLGNYMQADPQSFVTPVNDIQKAAFNNTGGLFGTGQGYGAAANLAAGSVANPLTAGQASYTASAPSAQSGAAQAQGASLLDNFNAYLNPVTDQVVNTTLADMDVAGNRAKAAQMGRYATTGAFGGSRSAIGEGLLDSELARARATADAQLRSNAFNTAAGLSSTDAGMRQGNSQFNAGQSNSVSMNNAQMANARALADAERQSKLDMFNTGQTNQTALAQQDAQLRAAQALAAISGSAADTSVSYTHLTLPTNREV